jgi:hypothetical protein
MEIGSHIHQPIFNPVGPELLVVLRPPLPLDFLFVLDVALACADLSVDTLAISAGGLGGGGGGGGGGGLGTAGALIHISTLNNCNTLFSF